MIEISFKQDIDYLLNGYRHFQRLGFAHFTASYKWVFLAVAIPIIYFSITSGSLIKGIALLLGLSLPMFSNYFDELKTRRNFSKSPFNDIEVTERFDEIGVHILSNQGEVKMPWSAFTEAVKFSDGFLLLTGPKVWYWMPSDAFVNPEQISDFEILIQGQVKKFRSL